jgi:pimeloyl-ACP methyl ester carboxylesterase
VAHNPRPTTAPPGAVRPRRYLAPDLIGHGYGPTLARHRGRSPNHDGLIGDSVDAAAFIAGCLPEGSRGEFFPVTLAPAKLTVSHAPQDALLVGIAGFRPSCADTGFLQGFQATHDLNNGLWQRAVDGILQSNSRASTLVVVGVSLGGMVAQQVCRDPRVRARFLKIYCVAIGAPPLGPDEAWDDTCIRRRLVDAGDPVRFLSVDAVRRNLFQGNASRRSWPDGTSVVDTHKHSYRDPETWKGFDALGEEGGQATISFKVNDRYFL